MSAPFKFKLKVKTGDGPAPAPSAGGPPPLPQRGTEQYAATNSQAIEPANGDHVALPAGTAQPARPAAAKPFKLKLKVAPSAAQPPAAAPAAQHWDAPHVPPPVAAAPPAHPPPVVSLKREAPDAAGAAGGEAGGAPPAPRPIKKIKLATGKPAGVPLVKKPIIKFKPPPKQPRDAPLQPAAGAGGGDDGNKAAAPRPLPIVRLTLPVVAAAPAAGPKRLKAKGPKVKLGPGGGGAKKVKPVRAGGLGLDGGGERAKRPKRSRADLKELRDLGVDDLEEFDLDLGSPLPPRTFTLRSTHAAAAAAAATAPSTGRGVSAGPAPSDALTGISGGAAAMDTAGTEAREDGGARQQQGAAPAAAVPGAPPKRDDFERLLTRCQKKDVHSMFKEPVTEAIAPGYFSVIKQPMDFSTMRSKAAKGEYSSWEDLRADMRLMFTNALTYNAEGGSVHNYAKLLMGQCDRIVELAMEGKTDFRSSATITRKHNAAVKAQQRAERDALRAQAKAEQRAAQEAKVLRKAGLASSYDEHEDENIRNSYRRPVRDQHVARWRGLGAGTNAEGTAWGTGRQVLRPVNPWLPPGMYALSLARFAANLRGRVRELVLQRATASTAADEAAERALQQQLAKKVPMPPPAPAPAPAPAAAAAVQGVPAAVAGGLMPGAGIASGLPQQPTAMQRALGAASAAAGSAASVAAAPAAMLQAQQQLLMQAQQQGVRPGGAAPGMLGMAGAGMPGGMAAAGMARPPGQALPPGATITLLPTAQGMVPFLMQPGQPPIMMVAPGATGMAPGMVAGVGQKPATAGVPAAGMPPVLMQQPGMPGAAFPAAFMPGMQPRPRP